MKYGLIGKVLSHSFSKEIHESIASYSYELCEIPQDKLSEFFRERSFCAINVTMPYKREVIPHLDEISPAAERIGAVNTVVNRGGRLFGFNTDYLGLRDTVNKIGVDLLGKKVLILGTGGTSRTAHAVAQDLGASEIVHVSRSASDSSVTYAEAGALHSDAQVIINTTPVGMFPDNYSSPIDIGRFPCLCALIDAVYNPVRTRLVQAAEERGIPALGGLYMLVSQAVHAIELFLDTELDASLTDKIYLKMLAEKQNIVLIGMPSSGKTTVGGILADELCRELYDLDDEIEKRIGCTIAEYFKTHTEKDFRDIETEITREISKRNGAVIATGGGCILRDENVRALRSSGRLYFLDRDIEVLTPTDSRPLATKKSDIAALYERRYPRYTSVCDVRVDANVPPQNVALTIRKEFDSQYENSGS